MPRKPPHPCNAPGCREVTHERFCAAHTQAERRRIDRERGGSTKRGYGSRWQRARRVYLAEHPWCVLVRDDRPCGEPSTVVDHIVPHRGDPVLFWDETNWQATCKPCHDAKTPTETDWGGARGGRGIESLGVSPIDQTRAYAHTAAGFG